MGNYVITSENNDGFVRILADGAFDIIQVVNLVTEARAVSTRSNMNLLYDVRNALTSMNTADLYLLTRTHPSLKTANAVWKKAAILVSRSAPKAMCEFYEFSAAEVGISARVFRDEEEALVWIK